MNRRIKRSFSLIEVMVSLILFALVMATLFGFLWHNNRATAALQSITNNVEKLHKVHVELQKIFSGISQAEKVPNLFYTEFSPNNSKCKTSLIFTFQNKIDHDKFFASKVLARLFCSKDQELCLAIWPDPKKLDAQSPDLLRMRKTVILDHVTAFTMQFWTPAALTDGTIPKKYTGIWLDSWEKKFKETPLLIKVSIEHEEKQGIKSYEYTFLLPKNIKVVTY